MTRRAAKKNLPYMGISSPNFLETITQIKEKTSKLTTSNLQISKIELLTNNKRDAESSKLFNQQPSNDLRNGLWEYVWQKKKNPFWLHWMQHFKLHGPKYPDLLFTICSKPCDNVLGSLKISCFFIVITNYSKRLQASIFLSVGAILKSLWNGIFRRNKTFRFHW